MLYTNKSYVRLSMTWFHEFLFFIDVDECILGTHDCLTDTATCTNTYGTYSCACNPGYVGDGKTKCEMIAPGICHGIDKIKEANRGYYLPACGYEFYLRAFNSISRYGVEHERACKVLYII